MSLFNGLLEYFYPKFLFKGEFDYCFLVHSRGFEDIYRKYPFLKIFPKILINFIAIHLWPITLARSVNTVSDNKQVKGLVIGVATPSNYLLSHRIFAKRKFIQAAKLAKKMNVNLLGLGALSSSLTRGGRDITDNIEIKVTTGHALTVNTIIGHMHKVIRRFNLDIKSLNIAIVGAAGSIGSNSALLIGKDDGIKKLLLIEVDSKVDEVKKIAKKIKSRNPEIEIYVNSDLNSLSDAHIVITATNHPDALIKSKFIRSGTVIIDDAQPSDVEKQIFYRDDVLVLEGGVVNIKDYNSNFNFGLKNKGDVFSCLGEAIILACEKKNVLLNHGRLREDNIFIMSELMNKYGVSIGEFQNEHRKYRKNDLDKFKSLIKK